MILEKIEMPFIQELEPYLEFTSARVVSSLEFCSLK